MTLDQDDKLKIDITAVKDEQEQLVLLQELCTKLVYEDPDLTCEYAEFGINLAKKLKDQPKVASFTHLQGAANYVKGSYERASTIFETSLALFTEIDDPLGIAKSQVCLGVIYEIQNDYVQAINLYQLAIKHFKKSNNIEGLSKVYNNLGIVYQRTGAYKQALEQYLNSIKIIEELPDEDAKLLNEQLIRVYVNVGSIHQKLGELEEAFSYYKESLKLAEEMDYLHEMGRVQAKIGSFYSEQGKYEEADKYYTSALKIKEKINDKEGICFTYLDKGKSYKIQNRKIESLEYFTKAFDLGKEIGIKTVELSAFNLIAQIYFENEKDEELKHWFEQSSWSRKQSFEELTLEAEQIVESITDFELKELAYQTLTTFYEKKEVYKKAFEYQRKLNELKINRYQQDKEAAISKIQVQFDTEQKERKINFQRLQLEKQELELVQKDQIEELNRTLEKKVKQRTLELERQNKELQQFAFIIAHDLKEPARKIGSFVNLLLRQHQSKFDPKSLELFDFILSNTKRINVQLEDLIGYTSLDTWDEKNKQTVDVERLVYDVLKDLTRMVEESQANIVVNVELENVMVNEKHLYALLKHLIQNSLKFARKDCENKVEITAQKIPGNYLFAVKDSGIGIEVEYQQRIFEIFKRLDQSHSGTGIGLAMCKKIVQLYKGKIWVDSEQGEGSTFFFTIPI